MDKETKETILAKQILQYHKDLVPIEHNGGKYYVVILRCDE